MPCVVVPGRNRILFSCVFWPHCSIWSAVARTFIKGGAHTCY